MGHFSKQFYAIADQNITLKRIADALYEKVAQDHQDKGEDWVQSTASRILKTNGLDKDRFDFLKQFKRIVNEKLNDVSIDDNSNKNEKTIAAIYAEVQNPIKKATGFDYLYCTMKELYGKDDAKRLSSLMYDYSIGLSDSSNIMIPYCYALDASHIVTEGRKFGQLPSNPSKRVSSYISALCETLHQMSSHFAGALAVGTFFFDIAHLMLIKGAGKAFDYLDTQEGRKTIENEFQQFVHSVNHLSRSAAESPFTNISIFDSVKVRHIVNKDLAWYFEGSEENDVVELVLKLQSLFLDFFDQGDPANSGLPYRFPVVTINLSKHLENDKWIVSDPDFLESVVNRDIYRYNIFTSEGTKTASCCRLISDGEMLSLASQSNSFGAGAVGNLGSHRVATINFNRIALEATSYEDYFNKLTERMCDARKILKSHKILIKSLADKGLQMFISIGWVSMARMFSTYGVMGLYEANMTMKNKIDTPYDGDFVRDVLVRLNDYITQSTAEDEGFVYNIEQIPGESYAVRLCEIDKALFGEELVPYGMYANQWVPLWEQASIWEKLEVDGKYNSLLTGGGIVHATIGETVTPYQAKKIIEHAVESGCEHFALNAVYSKCENGHMTMGDVNVCPVCSAGITDKLTRVVGFLTPVSAWNKIRREWEFPRRTKI